MAKDLKPSENNTEAERIERLRWLMDQNVPIIGGWMHRRIASALVDSAVSGNWLAAQSLAVVFALHEDAEVRKLAGQTLRKINYTTGIDAVWGVWAETRHPELEDIALEYKRPAGQPASVRLLSSLRLGKIDAITHGSAELVPALVQACSDRDARIAETARMAIHQLHNQQSIDMLCQMWRNNRSPFLAEVIQSAHYLANKPEPARVLSALKTAQLEAVLHSSPEMVAPLIEACTDRDPEIAARARQCLPQLQDQQAVDMFCKLWLETRSPLLEEVLIQAGYRAHGPVQVRLMSALKLGQPDISAKTPPTGLPFLLDALQDTDPTIQKNARAALAALKNEDTRDALCTRVIETDDPLAREIALSAGYTPKAPEMRALFYFLTGQWQAYDALDFDQAMLRAIYEGSPARSADERPSLRQRIAGRVQSAGRTDYLTILAGVDLRSRAEKVNPGEAELLIRVLTENREFERLWALAPELALPFSFKILQILSEHGWQPAGESDRQVFTDLQAFLHQPIQFDSPDLAQSLPLAIPRSTVKLRGRINEAAFSPTQPILAIATSQRKVVLWNFQTAQIDRVLGDFDRSVGKVCYTPRGWLLASERTNTRGLCSVSVYPEGEPFKLVSHEGTVTVLEPLGASRLLTAGRDQRAFIWDLEQKKKVAEKEFSFWPRSAAVSPDLQYAALLHDRLNLIRLPDLNIVPGSPFLTPRGDHFKSGVAQNAAFSPDGKFILSGQYNGQVGLHYHTSLTQRPRKAVVTQHSQPVRGIHFLPDHQLVISAGAEGHVRFIRWPEMTVRGMVYAPEGQLTSLRISQHGAFMATGTSESSMVLWDLRVLDIPSLFTQPLATAAHDQITTVMALSAYNSLPEPVRNGLRFLRVLLQYRFRYDVQIEEAPIIQFGDFDILLEDIQ